MGKVLTVLFPGFGYGPDKPLLHYAGKCAKSCGFDVINVNYSWLDMDNTHSLEERARSSMEGAVADALKAIESQTARLREGDYEKLIFVSKSFGTLVAGEIQKLLRDPERIYQIFLTPLPQTYEWYMQGCLCMAVAGTADQLMTEEVRKQMEADPNVDFLAVEGGNHSLENPKNPVQSVEALKLVTQKIWQTMQKADFMIKYAQTQENNYEGGI